MTPKETSPLLNASKQGRQGEKLSFDDDDRPDSSSSTSSTFVRWIPLSILVLLVAGSLVLSVRYIMSPKTASQLLSNKELRVAFLGNSMQYKNDLPRLLEAVTQEDSKNRANNEDSDGEQLFTLFQDSCLHPNATLTSLLEHGNGMVGIFNTTNAIIEFHTGGGGGDDDDDENNTESVPIYDYGQCTIYQLLFGNPDPSLEAKIHRFGQEGLIRFSEIHNPCIQDEDFFEYLLDRQPPTGPKPQWDYVVINDNTRSPGRLSTRNMSIATLKESYIPWFESIKATPVFLHTHAYWGVNESVTDIEETFGNMSYFTAITYDGYQSYQKVVTESLSSFLEPRIAPAGIAFLTVYEDYPVLWPKLFLSDAKHASPYGTLIQAFCVFATIHGRMPVLVFEEEEDDDEENEDSEAAGEDERPSSYIEDVLFGRSRQSDDTGVIFPTSSEAKTLYDVSARVVMDDYRPKSFVDEMERISIRKRTSFR